MINAGELTQRISLYQSIEGKTPNGAPINQIKLLCAVWAKIESGQNQQKVESDRDRIAADYSIKIRWRVGLSVGDWLNWRGKWFELVAIDDADPRLSEMTLSVIGHPESDPPIIV